MFINAHFRKINTPKSENSDQEDKRPPVLRVQFRGDAAAELFRRKVERSLKANCQDSIMRMIFVSRPLISIQTKDPISVMSTSNVIYRFTCTCGEQYIGLTERRLEDRVKEHIPNWLLMGNDNDTEARSSICYHLKKELHVCNRNESFEIIYKARHRRILKFVEAVAIRIFKPSLNRQQDLQVHLKLPWN